MQVFNFFYKRDSFVAGAIHNLNIAYTIVKEH